MKKTSPVIKDPIVNKKGLTLIELAIILSIISITSALSLPSMTSLWSNLRLNKAARDLMIHFHQAKMEAVKRNILCTTTFNVSLSGQDYDYVVYVDDDQDLEYDSGESVLKTVKFSDYKSQVGFDLTQGGGDGLSFANNDNSRPSIAFNSRGLSLNNNLSSGTGSVWIKNDRNTQKQVIISTAGMIKIN